MSNISLADLAAKAATEYLTGRDHNSVWSHAYWIGSSGKCKVPASLEADR